MASLARIPFRASDEASISSLAGWMTFVAVILFIAGGLGLIFFCLGSVGAVTMVTQAPLVGALQLVQMLLLIVICLLMIVQGVFLVQARGSLKGVVTSDTADQQHLSDAFRRLKLFFLLELGFAGLSLLTTLVMLVMTIVAPEMAGMGAGMDQGGFGGGGGNVGGGW